LKRCGKARTHQEVFRYLIENGMPIPEDIKVFSRWVPAFVLNF
jgi:hypothetical protein